MHWGIWGYYIYRTKTGITLPKKNLTCHHAEDDFNTERELHGWLPEIPVVPLATRYQIEGEAIGRGGFGIVYRAKKLKLPQYVAVKRMLPRDGSKPSPARAEAVCA
ncbi:MAG UNVERIFIED_CONTAM: hypothetical protein LVR18_22350 [Planctomycetaceae bacterium]